MMKKNKVSFLLALLLSSILALSVFAAYKTDEQGNPFVLIDSAAFSDAQWNTLNNAAADLFENYQFPIYMALFDDLSDYGYSADDIEQVAEDLYLTYDLGFGKERDGLLLIVDITNRRYDLAAHGPTGNAYFGTDQRAYLEQQFLDDFLDNAWYSGFYDYLDTAAGMLSSPVSNPPFNPFLLFITVVSSLVVALLVAGLRCSSHESDLKTAYTAQNASGYIASGGIQLHIRRDILINHFVTRESIERDGDSADALDSSSDFSHSSGSF